MQNIVYKRAELNTELKQILQLQNANLPNTVSETDQIKEAFLTVVHNFKLLKAMNNVCPHIIAVDKKKVIGYALCMDKAFNDSIDIIKPLFEKIEKNDMVSNLKYIVMGQVCIAKTYRGRGVFRKLYQVMKKVLQLDYDVLITEVDTKNIRSVNAHRAIGFNVLYSYRSNQQDWQIIYLNLK